MHKPHEARRAFWPRFWAVEPKGPRHNGSKTWKEKTHFGVSNETLQGYLGHEQHFPTRTLHQDFTQGPMVVLRGLAVSYERGTPVEGRNLSQLGADFGLDVGVDEDLLQGFERDPTVITCS